MTKALDLIGKTFNKLTVLERVENDKHGKTRWLCRCDCGNKSTVGSRELIKGSTTSCGCVRSSRIKDRLNKYVKIINGRWIWNAYRDKNGYGTISYKCKTIKAHRAVYQEYIGKIPEGMFVCHKNDIPYDITPSNLFLGTCQDNCNDMIKKGRKKISKGESNGMSDLKEKEVLEIRKIHKENNFTNKYIANKYNVSQSNISSIINRKSWKHI